MLKWVYQYFKDKSKNKKIKKIKDDEKNIIRLWLNYKR